uniref:PDZ domain-containing protein n=1 Tax=Lotharella oceanica TaxID=641309 RepID=A0A7S2TK78_9EUKA|mmetsp:Transcript_16231/g.30793  ORF Transcript_16231/g.30793 Transcript_16231/m.30793 type:complete len:200 (+) Transcript_16231:34-633(+)
MYGGRVHHMRKKLFMMVNSFLFWYSYLKRKQMAKIVDDVDVKVTMTSRPFGFSIAELRIGRNKFLEVSGVDGGNTSKSGVEPGWKIMSVAGKSTVDVDVSTLVGYCKEATLPCEIIFQKPGHQKIGVEDFISCIDAFIHLEPRIKTLFFATAGVKKEDKEDGKKKEGKPQVRGRSKSGGNKAEGIVQWLRHGLGRKEQQ